MVTASEMGKKGGQAKSEAKAAAARKNASKPRGKWVTAIAYQLDGVRAPFSFGCLLVDGKGPRGSQQFHDWVVECVRAEGVGLREVERIEFLELSTVARLI
jgi:hypothetical protein